MRRCLSFWILIFIPGIMWSQETRKLDQALYDNVQIRNYKAIEELLDKGANPNWLNYGTTPLMIPFGKLSYSTDIPKDLRIIDLLLSRGGDPSIREPSGPSCLSFLVEAMSVYKPELVRLFNRIAPLSPPLTTIYNKKYGTLLHFAAERGYLSAVKALLDLKMPVDILDDEGQTALDRGILHQRDEVIQTLLDNGASVFRRDTYGRTPLHLACISGSLDIAKKLIAAGADPNSQMDNKISPLGLSLYSGHKNLANYLLQLGVQTTTQGKEESLAMLMAVCEDPPMDESWMTLWDQILSLETDIDHVNDRNESLLFYICNNPKAQPLLPSVLARLPDVNLQNVEGVSALMLAVEKMDLDSTKRLVSAGALVSQVDAKRQSALDRAKKLTGSYGREIEQALSGYPWIILPPLPLGGGVVLGTQSGFYLEMDAHFIDLRFTGLLDSGFDWKTELTVSALPILGLAPGLLFGIIGGPYGFVYGYYIPGILAVNILEVNVGLGLEKRSENLNFYGPVYLGIRIPFQNDEYDWYKNFTLKVGWQSSWQNWEKGQVVLGFHLGVMNLKM